MMKKTTIFMVAMLLLSAASVAQGGRAGWQTGHARRNRHSVTVVDIQRLPQPQQQLYHYPPEDLISIFCYEHRLYDDTVLVHLDLPDSLIISVHSLIEGVRMAYADHRPFVLNPDVLWLVIAQGFALHVDHNADVLRPKLVGFDSIQPLSVLCPPGLLHQPAAEWEPYLAKFPQQMKSYVDPALIDLLSCDFSTTTPAAYTASQITLMSALKSYFSYEIIEACGIPKVYLEGTPADWAHLVEKANALRPYDLDWWIDELEPVLRKLAAAAAGEVDLAFWKSIYSDKTDEEEEFGCGLGEHPALIDGWIVKFYPYDSDGNRTALGGFDENDISLLPVESTACPLVYEEENGTRRDLLLVAGTIGLREDPKTQALRPEIIWMITTNHNHDD